MRTPEDLAYQEYMLQLNAVLGDFQFIEEALRLYLTAAYGIIQGRVKHVFPFELGPESVEKDALGTLIHKFSTMTSDNELVAELKALAPSRNSVAHRGFLEMAARRHDMDALSGGSAELGRLKERTSEAFEKIRVAATRLSSVDTRDA